MKAGRAFAAGVIGGIAMVVLMALARMMGMDVNLSMMLGTMIVQPPGAAAWITGFIMHLIIAGLIALVYAWGFEYAAHRAGWLVGVLFSLINSIVAGLFMGIVPVMHPMMRAGTMPAPGYFMANKGAMYVIALFVLHAVYGAIVGAVYGPVVHGRVLAPERSPVRA